MSYTAEAPAPPLPPEHEYTVTFRHNFESPADWAPLEKRIAEMLASEIGVRVTVSYQPPF